ncbi:TPA: hypothetical protein ACOEPF_000434 [Stenotrophomonas maltophilia]|uniref:hypothetical protein n=1 Tax=Stenotrophomonas TaxID=40323 RepID=UPI00201D0367|nr:MULTISPECIES: hypothetical protein [Stenotrophomonas]MBN5024485.1 hypothetical protein [Stenotrophomonas maltophilia]MDH1274525.1 hypothetical protein [Stenotrophomonas sp. GD03937]MDH1484978.1 hypothetical protein [Stenotrophomonas sp. GD03712]UQY95843.1 hypothetical protein LZ605_00295 [Stenotrophomonas maltophilia]UQY98093.1 hypothetical protein LZ605_22615 [Stenotrophomonas maltophilia]
MLIPDPLQPYAKLITAALWAAVAAALILMGARLGSDYRIKKDQALIAAAEKQRDKAQAASDENLRAATAAGQLLQEVNRQTQASIDAAEAARKASDAAARRAEKAAAEGQRRATAAEKALEAAKTQPACRAQLEQTLCDSIPLL